MRNLECRKMKLKLNVMDYLLKAISSVLKLTYYIRVNEKTKEILKTG